MVLRWSWKYWCVASHSLVSICQIVIFDHLNPAGGGGEGSSQVFHPIYVILRWNWKFWRVTCHSLVNFWKKVILGPLKTRRRRWGGVKSRFALDLWDPDVKLKILTCHMPYFGQFLEKGHFWPLKTRRRRWAGVKSRFALDLWDPEVKLKILTCHMPYFGQFLKGHFWATLNPPEAVKVSFANLGHLVFRISAKSWVEHCWHHGRRCSRTNLTLALCYRDRAFWTKYNDNKCSDERLRVALRATRNDELQPWNESQQWTESQQWIESQ